MTTRRRHWHTVHQASLGLDLCGVWDPPGHMGAVQVQVATASFYNRDIYGFDSTLCLCA